MARPPSQHFFAPLVTLLAALTACPRREAPPAPTAAPQTAPAASPTPGPLRDASAPREAPRDAATPARDAAVDGTRCTSDDDCDGDHCFNENLEAQYSRVLRDCANTRAWRDAHPLNTCVRPQCRDDGDCPDGHRCGTPPMSPFPERICVPAPCRWDVQCRRGSVFGRCAPYSGRSCERGGWHCVFPSDECSPEDFARRCRPRDGEIAYCVPVNGRFRCVTDAPAQP